LKAVNTGKRYLIPIGDLAKNPLLISKRTIFEEYRLPQSAEIPNDLIHPCEDF